MTFYLSLKNDVNVPSKKLKILEKKKLFLVGVLKATDEKSRIRIRTKMSRIPNTSRNPNYHKKNKSGSRLCERLPVPGVLVSDPVEFEEQIISRVLQIYQRLVRLNRWNTKVREKIFL
jgi:hypothetical protein